MMMQLRTWLVRTVGLLRKKDREAEMMEEIGQHLERLTERKIAAGMSPSEARNAARREFGGVEQIREIAREERVWMWPEQLWKDFRFALRQLRKSPAFTFVAILTLALGIGANVAIFSVVNAVLLRPFAFAEPEKLIWIWSQRPQTMRGNFTLPEFCDYRDQNTLLEGLAAIASYNANLTDQAEAERIQGVRLSANIFQILGVRPVLGRVLDAADDRPGAPAVALISHGLWARRYGKQSAIIGTNVTLNGEPRVIVGVLPPDFVLPNLDSEVVVPLQPESDARRNARNSVNFLRMVGRINPGVTVEQAHAELDSIRQNLRRQYPDVYAGKIGVVTVPLTEEIVGNSRNMLITILGAVAALLLIACVNLAGMSLARAAARQRELAVRSALGATRTQLIRLLLAESAVLAIGGGALGFFLAIWGSSALVSLVPTDLPRIHDLAIDVRVLIFAAGSILLAAGVCGLAPAWLLSRTDLRDALASGGRGSAGGSTQSRLRRWLVAGQVGLALVLLASAGLFLRSFALLSKEHPGFDPQNVLTVRLSLPPVGYLDRAALVNLSEKLLPRLAALPGVDSAAFVSLLPLAPGLSSIPFTVADHPPATGDAKPTANYRIVTPGYISAMRIPLRNGRDFTEEDDGERPPVALISAPLADKFFSDRSPIGQRLLLDDTDGAPRSVEIVGVIGEVKQEKLEIAASADIYLPLRQVPKENVPFLRNYSYWVMRTSIPPAGLEAFVRQEIRSVDPNVPSSSVRTMEQMLAGVLATRRFSLLLVGLFAATALIVAAAGLYAVIAYGVGQRTREIGLRLVLGATHGRVLRMILTEGLRLVLGGVVIGFIAAFALVNLISSQLYGVSARDPLSLVLVTALLAIISLLACLLAARRALRVDPAIALRAD
ncbi:MAG TPA: ABC transporter permease [Chthoniobacterales bacterium]